MTKDIPAEVRRTLPEPYRDAKFEHRRNGISDDPNIDVWVDADSAFALLHPRPEVDYTQYAPRQQTLKLSAYKKTLDVTARRLAKIQDLYPSSGVAADVGAANGAFLETLAAARPGLKLVAVEPDIDTLQAREALPLAGNFRNLDLARAAEIKADVVSLFHVFEHIKDPAPFVDQLVGILAPGGRIVIEVPSLDDPLLSVYASKPYEAFYFQRQHPFVYSRRSLERVLSANGLRVLETRPYQRYGLENHLGWLIHNKPGGDPSFAEIFSEADRHYRESLEKKGLTDTVFAIAETR